MKEEKQDIRIYGNMGLGYPDIRVSGTVLSRFPGFPDYRISVRNALAFPPALPPEPAEAEKDEDNCRWFRDGFTAAHYIIESRDRTAR